MKIAKKVLAVTAIVFMAGPIVAYAQGDYDYETINYPGASDTQLFAINNRGDVVGNGFGGPVPFPFIYDTKKGTFTDVPLVDGYDDTGFHGVSDSGVLVGSVFDADLGLESGVILDKKGNATIFDHPDAVLFTQARGINSRGLVTGFRDSANDLFQPENGFIYDPKTNSFTDIVPSLSTIAQGINSRGDVVGNAWFEDTDSPCPGSPNQYFRYGWLRTADGNVTFFDVNGGLTAARGITDSGTVAGFVEDTTTGVVKGFAVNLDGSQCQSITVADDDLLVVSGASATFVGGIKNSGAVVGSYDHGQGSASQGFIATPN